MRWLIPLAAIMLGGGVALADGGRVWVAPFEEANAATQPQPDWISRALRQSVLDDLSSFRGVTVATAPTTKPAVTQPADADYVVKGTIQRIEGELRVTGRVEQPGTGKIVGGFKATGTERDLFAIEDSIAGQLKTILAPAAPSPGVAGKPGNATTPIGRNGTFEGSELQRALEERDYLRRLQQQQARDYQPAPTYGYTQPVYPTLGLNTGYYYPPYYYPPSYGVGGYWWGGGSGFGFDGNNVIIIRQDNRFGGGHGRHGGNGGGGVTTPSTPAPLPAIAQNEAVRRAASWAGNPPPTMVHEINPGPQWVPGGTPKR